MDVETLITQASAGNDRALARLVSIVEDGADGSHDIAARLYRQGHSTPTLGITGAPGAGKSSLLSGLITAALDAIPPSHRIAVAAVDPSSPFTGGAILGDRIRMGEHSGNPRVFVRSIANRGHLGGLTASTPAVLAAFDAVGFGEIFVETVGVGQAEVDVASACLTTVVVVPAGWGDAVQVAKAGFLEVADMFVVNKADRPEADRTVSDLQAMLDIGPDAVWQPPVLTTIATEGEGIDDVWTAVGRHRQYLTESGELEVRRRAIAGAALRGVVAAGIDARLADVSDADIDRLVLRETDPWSLAHSILDAR